MLSTMTATDALRKPAQPSRYHILEVPEDASQPPARSRPATRTQVSLPLTLTCAFSPIWPPAFRRGPPSRHCAAGRRPRSDPPTTPLPPMCWSRPVKKIARSLVAELGMDDYLTALTMGARAARLEHLAMSGRLIGYVGHGEDDREVMTKALVAIAWRGTTTMTTNAAQVVLLNRELQALVRLFELAAAFTAKQRFNLMTPIGLDLADLATTLFLHWDLVYSVMFTYSGLLLGAVNGRLPATPAASTAPATAPASPLMSTNPAAG